MRLLASFLALAALSFVLGRVCYGSSTAVILRIEGKTQTIFEGRITTCGHNVTTVSGGSHDCDGTNNHVNPTPGPTCTSALDDAVSWDGTFSTTFDDYFVTKIGGDAQTATQFWGLLLNFQFTSVGGCQQRVNYEDQILWAFDAFNKAHFLKLDGPTKTTIAKPVQLTVTDGSTGSPVAGATVAGKTTDANGHVTVIFIGLGVQKLKAAKSDSLRSNTLSIEVALL